MLKTDYKDAMYDGQRRYRMVQNEDGTCSLPDATTYTQEGDRFGANDINATNTEVNKLQRTAVVTLPASEWSASPPYTQTVPLAEITAKDVPVIGLRIADGTTAANAKAQNKAWGCVDRAVAGNGTITYYCYNKKPAVNVSVNIKGV